MKNGLRATLLLPVLLTASFAGGQEKVMQLPENPHQMINKEGTCLDCHRKYLGQVDPHEFDIDVTDDCMRQECHQNLTGRMNRNHPVGVDPKKSRWKMKVPEEFPLDRGKLSCGTCHQPHLEWISPNKATPWEEPVCILEEKKDGKTHYTDYYWTFYLRVRGDQLGYETLCLSCHPDLF